MWLPPRLVSLIEISKDCVDTLQRDCAALRSENALLKDQLTKAEIMSDWLRMKVNQLEFERTALMERAYEIKLPVPEMIRQPVASPETQLAEFGFEHIDDDTAKRLGIAHLLS